MRSRAKKIFLGCCFLSLTVCGFAAVQLDQSSLVISKSAQAWLEKAVDAQGDEKNQNQFSAVNQLLADNNLNDAKQLLDHINVSHTHMTDRQKKNIFLADWSLKSGNPATAIRYLSKVTRLYLLSPDYQAAYYTVAIIAHLKNNHPGYSAIARMRFSHLITDPHFYQQNLLMTWHQLQRLPISRLHQLLSKSHSSLVRGFLELAILAKDNANSPDQLANAIKAWQLKYDGHPANQILPEEPLLVSMTAQRYPSKIALLLPLHGQFEKMGQAVRDGFMTAFYDLGKSLPQKADIKIYDTGAVSNIRKLYEQAIEEGAEFIIGPLTKAHAQQLVGMNIPVPTVVLNYVDNLHGSDHLIQFGLSPAQATQQAVLKMKQHNINKVLLIAPSLDWGKRLETVFVDLWKQSGGIVSNIATINLQKTLDPQMTALLNIDQSRQRTADLSQLLSQPFKTVYRRRQDVDAIFVLTDSKLTRQIHPLLRYYYAGNLPIYAISGVYRGYQDHSAAQDLDNIYFNDMPWLFSKNSVQTEIQSLWPENYKANGRLYGLGVDAYQLTLLFQRLLVLPHFPIHGMTGDLTLNQNQQVIRQLQWLQFQKGKAQLIS